MDFFMTKAMKRLTAAVKEISDRSYLPVQEPGLFRDLYGSLNMLDAEIRAGDRLRAQTDKMREEWIANITHDLKTPLSPIRGVCGAAWRGRRQNRRTMPALCRNHAEKCSLYGGAD